MRPIYMVLGLSIVLNLLLLFLYCDLHLKALFAEDQVNTLLRFRDMKNAGEMSSGEFLEQIDSYYPSGSKQPHGSVHDRIVEGVRLSIRNE